MNTFPIERLRELASFYQFKLFFDDEEYAELLDKFCGIEETIDEYAYVLNNNRAAELPDLDALSDEDWIDLAYELPDFQKKLKTAHCHYEEIVDLVCAYHVSKSIDIPDYASIAKEFSVDKLDIAEILNDALELRHYGTFSNSKAYALLTYAEFRESYENEIKPKFEITEEAYKSASDLMAIPPYSPLDAGDLKKTLRDASPTSLFKKRKEKDVNEVCAALEKALKHGLEKDTKNMEEAKAKISLYEKRPKLDVCAKSLEDAHQEFEQLRNDIKKVECPLSIEIDDLTSLFVSTQARMERENRLAKADFEDKALIRDLKNIFNKKRANSIQDALNIRADILHKQKLELLAEQQLEEQRRQGEQQLEEQRRQYEESKRRDEEAERERQSQYRWQCFNCVNRSHCSLRVNRTVECAAFRSK